MRIQDLFAKKRLLFLSAALFAFQLNARADEDAPPALQWHGYGNITNSRIYKENDQGSTVGYGNITKRGTFLYNSILGLNMSYTFNDKITFYGQLTSLGSVVASGFNTDSYPVRVDMAFLNYHPFDWIDVRIGRQIMPTWMYSEQIDVSATFPWIRPPSDVYNLAPMKSANGVGIDVVQNFADVYDVKAGIRVGDGTYVDPSSYDNAHLTQIVVAYGEFKYNNMLTLRASYGQTDAFAKTNSTGQATKAVWNGLDGKTGTKNLANLIALPSVTTGAANWETVFKFASLGGKLEYKDLLLVGEYAGTNQQLVSITATNSSNIALVPTGSIHYRSWYGTAAYHIGDWTPHLTYSQVEKNFYGDNYAKITGFDYGMNSLIETGGGYTAANPFIFQPNLNRSFGTASADIVAAGGFNPSDKIRTITAGLNYNFTPTIVGKVQLEQVRTSADADLIRPSGYGASGFGTTGAYGAVWLNAVANGLSGTQSNPFSPNRPKNFNMLNGQQVSANDIMTIGVVAVAFVF